MTRARLSEIRDRLTVGIGGCDPLELWRTEIDELLALADSAASELRSEPQLTHTRRQLAPSEAITQGWMRVGHGGTERDWLHTQYGYAKIPWVLAIRTADAPGVEIKAEVVREF
jgi:hypothetical protein